MSKNENNLEESLEFIPVPNMADKSDHIIVFDTNYVLSNYRSLTDTISKIRKYGYKTYIPEICVDEIKYQRKKEVIDKYIEIRKLLDDGIVHKYLSIKDYSNIDKAKKNCDENVDGFIENTFSKNRIRITNYEKYLKDTIARAGFKTAPFNNEQGSSDKGFKDTLIWLSIMDFAKSSKLEYQFTLISNDNVFIKYKSLLIDEFFKFTERNITICPAKNENDILLSLGLIENKVVTTNIFENESRDLSNKFIQKINEDINVMVQTYIESPFTNLPGNWYKNFEIDEMLDSEKTTDFLKVLEKEISGKYAFHIEVGLSNVFRLIGINCVDKYKVKKEILDRVIVGYNSVAIQMATYAPAYVELVMSRINENYSKIIIDPNDLPF